MCPPTWLYTSTLVFDASTIPTKFFISVIGCGQPSMRGITFCEVITAHAAIVMTLLFVIFAIAALFVTHVFLLTRTGLEII